MKYKVTFLRSLNLAAGCLHLLSGIGLIVYTCISFDNSLNTIDTSTYNVVIRNCNEDTLPSNNTFEANDTCLAVDLKKDFGTDTTIVVLMIICLTFLTALFHFIVFALKKYYKSAIEETQNNYLRWIEYGITATTMVIVIGFSVGVKTTSTFVLASIMSVVLMALGFVNERCKNNKDKVANIVVSTMGFLLLLGFYSIFFYSYADVKQNISEIPNVVTPIVVLEFLLFSCFGIVQMLYLSDKIDYSQDEFGFVVLSFVSKVLLSWMLFIGVVVR